MNSLAIGSGAKNDRRQTVKKTCLLVASVYLLHFEGLQGSVGGSPPLLSTSLTNRLEQAFTHAHTHTHRSEGVTGFSYYHACFPLLRSARVSWASVSLCRVSPFSPSLTAQCSCSHSENRKQETSISCMASKLVLARDKNLPGHAWQGQEAENDNRNTGSGTAWTRGPVCHNTKALLISQQESPKVQARRLQSHCQRGQKAAKRLRCQKAAACAHKTRQFNYSCRDVSQDTKRGQQATAT